MNEETAPVSVLTCVNCGARNRMLRNRQPVDRIAGALPKQQLEARITPHLSQPA